MHRNKIKAVSSFRRRRRFSPLMLVGLSVPLVPAGDPMVLNNNQPDLNKVNAYRAGVDQPPARRMAAASTTTYCQHLLAIGPTRIQLDMPLTQGKPSADPAAANSLFTFLAQRFVASYGPNGLSCAGLLNTPDPVAVTTDGNGVAISATFNAGNTNNNSNGNGNGAGATPTAPATSPTATPTTDPNATPSPTTDPTMTPTIDPNATPTPATSPTATPTVVAGN